MNVIKGGKGKLTDFVHLVTIHQGECKGFKTTMYVNQVESGGRGNSGKKGNVNSDEVRSANLVDKDSGLKVIAISKEGVESIGKLGRKDNGFPLIVVSGKVELRHSFLEAGCNVRVR